MEDFIVTRLVLCVTTLITARSAIDAPGIYCSNKAQTWLEAVIGCRDNGGKPVSYETDIGKPVANLSLNSDVDIWTADYATHDFEEDDHRILCGFVYFDSATQFIGNTFYGDCYAQRYYFCKNKTTSTFEVFKSTYSGIKSDCKKTVDKTNINTQVIKPGFYWTIGIQKVNTVKGKLPPTYKDVLCGAYRANIGQYFINCSTTRHSLCQTSESGNEGGVLDKSCFSEKYQTPTIETTPKSTVKNVEPLSSETETMLSTTKASYSSTDNRKQTPTGSYLTTDAVATQTKIDTYNQDKSKKLAVEKHDSSICTVSTL